MLKKLSRVGHLWLMLTNCTFAMESVIDQTATDLTDQTTSIFPADKEQLLCLILKHTQARLNTVQYARDFLVQHTQKLKDQDDLKAQIDAILQKLIQPEDWLLRLTSSTQRGKAIEALEQFVSHLEAFYRKHAVFRDVLKPVIKDYRKFIVHYNDDSVSKDELLLPKALLLTEDAGMGGLLRSYRMSQTMALKITSLSGFSSGGICTFEKRNEKGAHAVCSLVDAEKKEGVHFKAHSETELAVGYEAAVYWFSYLLFGHGQAASSLVTVSGIDTWELAEDSPIKEVYSKALQAGVSVTDFFSKNPQWQRFFVQRKYATVLQASHHVPGVSLDEFIENQEKGATFNLDSFSEQVVLNLLTLQADFKPDNLMVTQNPALLVGIDNDVAFAGPLQKTGVFKKEGKADREFKHLVSIKNILFLLPAMSKPVSKKVIKAITDLDADLCIFQWLELLRYQEQRYNAFKDNFFLTSDYAKEPFLSDHLYTEALGLPITFSFEMIQEMRTNIKKLQKYVASHKGATHFQLLNLLYPIVAKYYKEHINKDNVIETFFKAIYQKGADKKVYIEDCVDLDELIHGVKIKELLAKIPPPNQTVKRYTVSELVKHFLQRVDLITLNQKKKIASFLKSIYSAFKPEFLAAKEKGTLHNSWDDCHGKFSAIVEAKTDPSALTWFIENGVEDKGESYRADRLNDIIYVAIRADYSFEFVSLLIEKLRKIHSNIRKDKSLEAIPSDFATILCQNSWERKGGKSETVLDLALRKKKRKHVRLLIHEGAVRCAPENALSYYKSVLQSTSASSKDLVAFNKLLDRNHEVAWVLCLENIVPEMTEKRKNALVLDCEGRERLLPMDVAKQLFESPGKFKKVVFEGATHTVARATVQDPILMHRQYGIYFKEMPSIPGREEAAGRFVRQLFGFGAPHTLLVKMHAPVMLSHEIEGPTLAEAFKDKSPRLEKLNKKNISGLIIAAMLINPEDGKPNNIVVTKDDGSDSYSLSIVDNDHGFIDSLVRHKRKLSETVGAVALRVKTILFCFDQMKEPVHPDIRNKLLSIEVLPFLEQWAGDLATVHAQYLALFSEADHAAYLDDDCVTQGVPFRNDTIINLYNKFELLQNILRDEPKCSHIELLCKLEPDLGKIYSDALMLNQSPLARWEQVDGPSYKKTLSGTYTTLSKAGTVLPSGRILGEKSLLQLVKEAEDFTAKEALEQLKKKLRKDNHEVVQQLLKNIRQGDSSFEEEVVSVRHWEKLLENPGISLDTKQQKALLGVLQGQQFTHLTLRHLPAVMQSWFSNLDYSHVIKLDLRSCQKLTDIVSICKRASRLEELNLGGITTLISFADASGLQETDLELFKLKNLSLLGCTNLKTIKIAAPFLRYLNISSCPLISSYILDGIIHVSREIAKLDCKDSGVEDASVREALPQLTTADLSSLASGNPNIWFLESSTFGFTKKEGLKKATVEDTWLLLYQLYRIGNYFELGADFEKYTIVDAASYRAEMSGAISNLHELEKNRERWRLRAFSRHRKKALPYLKDALKVGDRSYAQALLAEFEQDKVEEALVEYRLLYETDTFKRAECAYRLAELIKNGVDRQSTMPQAIKLYRKIYSKIGFNFLHYLNTNCDIIRDEKLFLKTKALPESPVDLRRAFRIYTFLMNVVKDTEYEKSIPLYKTLFKFFTKEVLTLKALKNHLKTKFHFMEFLQIAAEEGMPIAIYNLALCYQHGFVVDKNMDKSDQLILRFLELKFRKLPYAWDTASKYPRIVVALFMDVQSKKQVDALLLEIDVKDREKFCRCIDDCVAGQAMYVGCPVLEYTILQMRVHGNSKFRTFVNSGKSLFVNPDSFLCSPYITQFMGKDMEEDDFREIQEIYSTEQIIEILKFLKIKSPSDGKLFKTDEFSSETVLKNIKAFEDFLGKKEKKE